MLTGQPVKLNSSQVVPNDAPTVDFSDLRDWFLERGFIEKERHESVSILACGSESALFGRQDVVTLTLARKGTEVEHVYIRFLLTEKTPARWESWDALIQDLGCQFEFQLVDCRDDTLVSCSQFLSLLAVNHNFQNHRKKYGWDLETQR